VSATFRRRDKLEWAYHAHCGRIAHTTSIARLTGQYVLRKIDTNLRDDYFKISGRVNFSRYVTAITQNNLYNKWLVDQLLKSSAAGRKVLVVSDRINHLVELKRRLLEKGEIPGLYVGAVNGKRLTKEKLARAREKRVILATYAMFNEGTDVPSLDTLFLTTPRSDIEQVVGRICRFHENKKSVLVVDSFFNTPFMVKMLRKRIRMYERLGFSERVEK